MSKRKLWTAKELAILKKYYPKKPTPDVKALLGDRFSVRQIRNKANYEGIKKDPFQPSKVIEHPSDPDLAYIELVKRKGPNKRVLVDREDLDIILAKGRWHELHIKEHSYAYTNQTGKTLNMHRFIAEEIMGITLLPKQHIDHINGDGLDNRKCNLRQVSRAINQSRGCKGRGWTYDLPRGVTKSKSGSYIAQIGKNRENARIGAYDTVKEAESAYRAARAFLWPSFDQIDVWPVTDRNIKYIRKALNKLSDRDPKDIEAFILTLPKKTT